MMNIPFKLKKLIPGYTARWRWRYRALINEMSVRLAGIDLGWDRDTPLLRSKSTDLVLRGFATESENIQVYEMLRPELPVDIPESHFRLMKDYITRYVYPHMRPDLKPAGFSTEQLWGFHGQHKDAIADADTDHQMALAAAFLGRPDDVIVDGGAFLGFGEARIAPDLTDGRIVAVEASAVCFKLLSRNMTENNFDNVMPLHRAIWNIETEIDLESSYAQANSLVSEVHKGERLQPVRTASIDSIVAECDLSKVDMISLTLNGAEVEALDGARETLKRWHPRIRLAGWYQRDGQPIWKITTPILESYGYRVFAGRRGNLMALHPSRA